MSLFSISIIIKSKFLSNSSFSLTGNDSEVLLILLSYCSSSSFSGNEMQHSAKWLWYVVNADVVETYRITSQRKLLEKKRRRTFNQMPQLVVIPAMAMQQKRIAIVYYLPLLHSLTLWCSSCGSEMCNVRWPEMPCHSTNR